MKLKKCSLKIGNKYFFVFHFVDDLKLFCIFLVIVC